MFKVLLLALLVLPVLSNAAYMQTMPMRLQTTPSGQLLSIGKQLAQLHTDLAGIKTQSNSIWQQYQRRDDAKQLPSTNSSLLGDYSDFNRFSDGYIYTAPQQNIDSGYSYTFACQSLAELKTPFCHDNAKSNQASFDVSAVMPYGNTLQNFSFSSAYIDSLLQSVKSTDGATSAQEQLPSASIVYRVLNSVGNQYDTTSGGTLSAGKVPSRMQQLQTVVAAPFTKAYLSTLSQASTPESMRALTEVASVGNLMKYKQLKQGQSLQVLLSGLLVQQMRTNYLLEQNLKFLKSLAKHAKGV